MNGYHHSGHIHVYSRTVSHDSEQNRYYYYDISSKTTCCVSKEHCILDFLYILLQWNILPLEYQWFIVNIVFMSKNIKSALPASY